MTHLEQQYRECIEASIHCMNACNVCFVACLKEFELADLRDCIRLARECSDICHFASQSMIRTSPFMEQICELTIKACESCADECELHEHEHCRQCAEACRVCADTCRFMLVAS